MRTSVRNCPHSGGSTSSANTTAPSASCSSVAASAACHRPSRALCAYEESGGGDRSASGSSSHAQPQPLAARQVARGVAEQLKTHLGPGGPHTLLPVGEGTRPGEAVGGEASVVRGCGQVQATGVVKQHAPHVEAR